MEDRLVYLAAAFQMLDDDPLEQFRRDARVPHTLGVDDKHGPRGAHAEARDFAAFHPAGTEEQVFPLEKLGELRVERAAAPVG